MKKRRLMHALPAGLLIGATLIVGVGQPASAAISSSITVTACSGSTPGTVKVTVLGMAATDTIRSTFTSAALNATSKSNTIWAGTAVMPLTETVGSNWTLPVSAAGVVSGIVTVAVDTLSGSTAASHNFTITGCGSLRTLRVTKQVLGIPPVGAAYVVRTSSRQASDSTIFADASMNFPATGGTLTFPIRPLLNMTVTEPTDGRAVSTLFADENGIVPTGNSFITIPSSSSDQQVRVTNNYTTRPVTIGKIWKDANGATVANSSLAFLGGFSMNIQAWDATGPYGPIKTCTYNGASFLLCPILDVPPTGFVRLISETGAPGYSPLMTGSYPVSQCGPIANVGSTEFPDFQYPACSVVVYNQQDPLPPVIIPATTPPTTPPTTPATTPPTTPPTTPATTPPTTPGTTPFTTPSTTPTTLPSLPTDGTKSTTAVPGSLTPTTSLTLVSSSAPAVAIVAEPTFTG